MKTFKHCTRLLLACLLLVSLLGSVCATPEGTLDGGKITITNAVKDQTYNVYQILYLESYNKDTGAYSYKANSAWETWLKAQTTYLSFDPQGYVTWVKDADAAAFAKLAQTKAKTMTADASKETTSDGTVEFTDLKLGYYLVDTTLGTLCSLDTTNSEVTMTEKNTAPTNAKTVLEDSGTSYVSANDAEIGQTITFQSTITAQAGAENYTLHDKMVPQLTFIEVTGVTLNSSPVDAANYTLKETAFTDDCTFELSFAQSFCDTLKANDKIIVTYTAYLNGTAVANTAYTNQSYLRYGDSNHPTETAPSETTSKTWNVNVLKQSESGSALSGATFKLSASEAETDAYKFIKLATNQYRLALASEAESALTSITTDASGQFEIIGLDSADAYYLIETEAPAGYNKLKSPIKFTLDSATGNVKYNFVDDFEDADLSESNTITVTNKTGALLPSTGGMGTTVFYILGSVLALGAVVLLVTRKRMKTEE